MIEPTPHDRFRWDLLAIHETIPALHVALRPVGSGPGNGIHTKPTSRPPLNLDASDMLHELEEWAAGLAKVLFNQTKNTDTPWLAGLDWPANAYREIHHWVTDNDMEWDAGTYAHTRKLRAKADEVAFPSGIRRIPLGVTCRDETCPGEYRAHLIPGDRSPSMVCTEDTTHTMKLADWGHGKLTERIDPAAAARFLQVMTGR